MNKVYRFKKALKMTDGTFAAFVEQDLYIHSPTDTGTMVIDDNGGEHYFDYDDEDCWFDDYWEAESYLSKFVLTEVILV